MSQPTLWEKVKTGGKSGFDKTWKAMDKLGAPVNKLSNKVGSEAFWPTTLDKESDKAARILKTFCKDGFYAEEEYQPAEGPKQKQKVVKKIPTEVIKNAKGLAIFTTMRTGLWVSGAGGSGVLIARKADGTWSPPSGILLHTAGLGFLVGIDIYDCVVVINTEAALEAFTKVRCTLGSEISVSAGPVGAGGVLDTEVHKRQSAIFTYLKSRGFYAGVQIDGTVIIERTDENERFYGERIPVADIIAGKVRYTPYEVRQLLETVRAAQGDTDVDESLIPTEAPPSDYVLEDGHMFGIPDKEDPDPYGVLALEKEGMSIKEAGTQKRASWEAFSFNPSPTSPVHTVYSRNSMDRHNSTSRPNSWRMSGTGPEPKSPLRVSREIRAPPPLPPRQKSSRMVDSSTQTDESQEPGSPSRSMHRRTPSNGSLLSGLAFQMQEVPEDKVFETSSEQKDLDTKTADSSTQVNGYNTPPRTPPVQDKSLDEVEESESHTEESHIEEPVVHSVQTVQPAAASQVISKARIVNVPKRVAPKLPARNPNRSGPVVVDASPKDDSNEETFDDQSKHDSALEVGVEKDGQAEQIKEKMDEVRLDDDENDETMRPNPWAKVKETKKREAEEASTNMPGGFVQ